MLKPSLFFPVVLLTALVVLIVSYRFHVDPNEIESQANKTLSSMSAPTSRRIVKTVLNIEQGEGVGARVRRSIGTRELRNFSPFLMLDHFKLTEGAGFPDHPHRGMTTLTYLLRGSFLHEDILGNRGKLGPGDLQFMIAGKGIVHSEIPLFEDGGVSPEGLQLWIDLPSNKKNVDASYQDKKAYEVPSANPSKDVAIKVICGESQGDDSQGLVESPVRPLGGCWFFDIQLSSESATVFQHIPKGWNAFFYTLEGEVQVDEMKIKPYHTSVLSNEPSEEGVLIVSKTPNSRLILVAGEPLDQPIYQYGPFVADSQSNIQKAFADYSMEQNGFENAHSWQSRIKKLMDNPRADVGQNDL